MQDVNLHVISFNIPYPPNYGGVIDVYYKVLALHQQGARIYLHCFDYGRGQQTELEKLCVKVYYYKRNTGIFQAVGKLPYIVKSRYNKELINNLLNDNYPILFEGLHSTFFLNSIALKNRIKIVRTHNIEHHYYQYLGMQEKNIFKRFYFLNAAKKLEKYEKCLSHASLIASISINDTKYFAEKYNKTFWLPPFHPDNEINVALGKGKYALYHGNLSVPENIKAALFIINIFSGHTDIPIVICGKQPEKQLFAKANNLPHIKIIANPSEIQMQHLIAEAQVHLLPTFQTTGIKLKLLASLFRGRHCIVNNEMVSGTGLSSLCHIANSAADFVNRTKVLMDIPFENKDLIIRKELLHKKFDNKRNAEQFMAIIAELNP